METTNIDSIEELTLFALGRSAEGLDKLCEASRACGASAGDNSELIPKISALATDLRDFDVFQNDICSFFMLETDMFRDQAGTLAAARQAFRDVMDKMSEQIEQARMPELQNLLVNELPEVLVRFKVLLPLVGEYIRNEYLQTA